MCIDRQIVYGMLTHPRVTDLPRAVIELRDEQIKACVKARVKLEANSSEALGAA